LKYSLSVVVEVVVVLMGLLVLQLLGFLVVEVEVAV
jgi:hypothetical protein